MAAAGLYSMDLAEAASSGLGARTGPGRTAEATDSRAGGGRAAEAASSLGGRSPGRAWLAPSTWSGSRGRARASAASLYRGTSRDSAAEALRAGRSVREPPGL